MADQFDEVDPPTTPGDPDNIKVATDKVIINGIEVKAQWEKPGYGDIGDFTPVTETNRLPVETRAVTARNTTGTASAVAPGGTATVVSYMADSAFRCRGFIATGTTDGYFELKYGGATVYAGRIHGTQQNFDLQLPAPDAGAAGQTVTIDVTNKGPVTGNYLAALLGQ